MISVVPTSRVSQTSGNRRMQPTLHRNAVSVATRNLAGLLGLLHRESVSVWVLSMLYFRCACLGNIHSWRFRCMDIRTYVCMTFFVSFDQRNAFVMRDFISKPMIMQLREGFTLFVSRVPQWLLNKNELWVRTFFISSSTANAASHWASLEKGVWMDKGVTKGVRGGGAGRLSCLPSWKPVSRDPCVHKEVVTWVARCILPVILLP